MTDPSVLIKRVARKWPLSSISEASRQNHSPIVALSRKTTLEWNNHGKKRNGNEGGGGGCAYLAGDLKQAPTFEPSKNLSEVAWHLLSSHVNLKASYARSLRYSRSSHPKVDCTTVILAPANAVRLPGHNVRLKFLVRGLRQRPLSE